MTKMLRAGAVLALLFIVAVDIFSAVRLGERAKVDGDEVELLHAGFRMAHGERIYVDFFEHHPPFIPIALQWLVTSSVSTYVLRARLLACACGAIALAAAGFIVWRATRQIYVAAIFLGVMLASVTVWTRAFTQVRSEPPALAAFWCGAALILVPGGQARRRIAFGAAGIGLVTLSCLINPKWPIASIVVGLFFLAGSSREGRRTLILAVLAGAAAAGCALLLLIIAVPPQRYFDFVFVFNRYMFDWWKAHPRLVAHDEIPWFHCPSLLLPRYVVPLAAIVATACAALRGTFANVRLVWAFLALLVAALLELRFVDPWPGLWNYYYSLYGVAAAAIYACAPQAFVAIVRRWAPNVVTVARAVPVVATLLAVANAPAAVPVRLYATRTTGAREALAAQLRPDDTVFLITNLHPIGARDASYYWFGVIDVIPAAIDFAKTPAGRRFLPPITEEDLPPCRLDRGLDPHLRFVTAGDELGSLPVVAGCVARLRARGVLVPMWIQNVDRVQRNGAAALQ